MTSKKKLFTKKPRDDSIYIAPLDSQGSVRAKREGLMRENNFSRFLRKSIVNKLQSEDKALEPDDLATMFAKLGSDADFNIHRSEMQAQFDSIAAKILAADIHEEPTPYINLEDVFGAEFYAAMVKTVETCECFLDIAQLPYWQGEGEHHVLRREELINSILNTQHQTTRSNLVALQLLIDTARKILSGAIAQKFAPWIPECSDDVISDVSCDSFIKKDVSGYGILPHTESLETVAVCMCYLPRDHALSPYGTALMRPNDAKKKCLGVGNPLFPSDEFEVETRVGGKPNSLMAFVKTPTSWHSLPPLPNLPYARHYLSLVLASPSRISDVVFHERLSKGDTRAKGWSL